LLAQQSLLDLGWHLATISNDKISEQSREFSILFERKRKMIKLMSVTC
jgi:hypothetical protein